MEDSKKRTFSAKVVIKFLTFTFFAKKSSITGAFTKYIEAMQSGKINFAFFHNMVLGKIGYAW